MLKLTNLNQISQKLEDEIPDFGPGDVRTFQSLNGNRMEDAETGKVEICYGKFSIRCVDTIFDPYLREGRGNTVNIGVVSNYEGEKVIEYLLFFPCKNVVKFLGKFDLIGDNPEDVEVFKFLWLSNFLKNNPHRNKREQPMFEMLPYDEKPLVKQELDKDGHIKVTALGKSKEAKEKAQQIKAELQEA